MGRPPDWERIARNQHFSEVALWQRAQEEIDLVFLRYTNGSYRHNSGLLMQDIGNLKAVIAAGKMLSTEIQSVLEDKAPRTALEIGQRIERKRRQLKYQ